MKIHCKKIISVFCAVILFALLFCSCSADPNVKQEDAATKDYQVRLDDGESEEEEQEGFHAYGSGKTEPVMLGGVSVEVGDFAVRSYELAYMMAEKEFEKPTDIPTELAVQYAFTHVFFKDFYSITNKSMVYRDTTADKIREELKNQFGTDDFDVTSSVLYNPEKELFEMWVPEYGTNIYYHIDAVNIDGEQAQIITTFYNELARETMLGRTTITVGLSDGKPVIRSLDTE